MRFTSDIAHKIVETFDKREINPYITLAKYGLWLCSVTLFFVIICGVYAAVLHGNTEFVGNVVQACQVLSMIAITVLGFHGYQGSRLFYELRNWNEPKKPLTDPEAQ